MSNPQQLKILEQGVEVWNRWRAKDNRVEVNLRNARFVGVDLKKADFNLADLSNADFSGARLSEAFFGHAKLCDMDLRESDLWKANLYFANLNGANLSSAILSEADLYHANLSEADISHADLNEANLGEANLSYANLYEANLSKTNLRNANLTGANLTGANLSYANLSGANLSGAKLNEASLNSACLKNANLSEADFQQAQMNDVNLIETKLRNADLRGAYLYQANLMDADLGGANLGSTDLSGANFIRTIIDKARISGSSIYGINVWDIKGEFDEQEDLVVTPEHAPIITVDNIKVAQFIYLILNNHEIREVINTLTSKSVLILGRFALSERKTILDAMRNKLREYDLLPIVFDFDRPTDKDFTETIKTLAGLSYFVIADVTNPKSSPLELQATVPDYQIPFVPIIQEGERPFAMMADLQKKYNWVLNTVSYDSEETLMKVLQPLIIDPAMAKRQELRLIKAHEPEIISGKEYLAKGKK